MDHAPHDEPMLGYLQALYAEGRRRYACRARTAPAFRDWQTAARAELSRLLGLDAIARATTGPGQTAAPPDRVALPGVRRHPGGTPTSPSTLDGGERADGYTRHSGAIETEPGFAVPFRYLVPDGNGPFPLAVTPHGHDRYGADTSAGIAHDEAHRAKIAAEDRDVAVQAARRGFAAIAPAARGTSATGIPDRNDRHGGRDCRSQLMHALLAGRTATGERVWDVMRLIDWAQSRPEIDASTTLVMGNSGGGVITIFAAAVDPRVTVAVPSCSYCTFVGEGGLIHHCDCNAVPGIMGFGEVWDVAGLIAPRRLCVVNGRNDDLFPASEVERAVAGLRSIYEVAGFADRFEHHWGGEGHRFYADLMWPFIERALGPLQ